jgi:hypothetical protein
LVEILGVFLYIYISKQEPAKRFTTIMSKLLEVTILSFCPRPSGSLADAPSFNPYAIKRNSDGEIFTIGDHFINYEVKSGYTPFGTITGFTMLSNTVFIKHTWSGIEFSLDAITKKAEIPSKFQYGEKVFWGVPGEVFFNASILAIHFLANGVKYDVILKYHGKEERLYNVNSTLVHKIDEKGTFTIS